MASAQAMPCRRSHRNMPAAGGVQLARPLRCSCAPSKQVKRFHMRACMRDATTHGNGYPDDWTDGAPARGVSGDTHGRLAGKKKSKQAVPHLQAPQPTQCSSCCVHEHPNLRCQALTPVPQRVSQSKLHTCAAACSAAARPAYSRCIVHTCASNPSSPQCCSSSAMVTCVYPSVTTCSAHLGSADTPPHFACAFCFDCGTMQDDGAHAADTLTLTHPSLLPAARLREGAGAQRDAVQLQQRTP